MCVYIGDIAEMSISGACSHFMLYYGTVRYIDVAFIDKDTRVSPLTIDARAIVLLRIRVMTAARMKTLH